MIRLISKWCIHVAFFQRFLSLVKTLKSPVNEIFRSYVFRRNFTSAKDFYWLGMRLLVYLWSQAPCITGRQYYLSSVFKYLRLLHPGNSLGPLISSSLWHTGWLQSWRWGVMLSLALWSGSPTHHHRLVRSHPSSWLLTWGLSCLVCDSRKASGIDKRRDRLV